MNLRLRRPAIWALVIAATTATLVGATAAPTSASTATAGQASAPRSTTIANGSFVFRTANGIVPTWESADVRITGVSPGSAISNFSNTGVEITLPIVAVNGSSRLQLLPEVPTYAEMGIKGYEEVIFTAVFAPAATPASLIQSYNAVIAKLVKSADFADKLSNMGISAAHSSPSELGARVQATHQAWTTMVKNAGFKPQ